MNNGKRVSVGYCENCLEVQYMNRDRQVVIVYDHAKDETFALIKGKLYVYQNEVLVESDAGSNKRNRRAYWCGAEHNGTHYYAALHDIVAWAFDLNWDKMLSGRHVINHMSGDTTDNTIENLEVATTGENNHHAVAMRELERLEWFTRVEDGKNSYYYSKDNKRISVQTLNKWNLEHPEHKIVGGIKRYADAGVYLFDDETLAKFAKFIQENDPNFKKDQ